MINPVKPNIVTVQDIVDILAVRTGFNPDTIHTMLHYYERIILHQVMKGGYVKIDNLFVIYHQGNQVVIEFTEKAKRQIKKK